MKLALFLFALPLLAQPRLDVKAGNSSIQLCDPPFSKLPPPGSNCSNTLTITLNTNGAKLASISYTVAIKPLASVQFGIPVSVQPGKPILCSPTVIGQCSVAGSAAFLDGVVATHGLQPWNPFKAPGVITFKLQGCSAKDLQGKAVAITCGDSGGDASSFKVTAQ